MMKNNKAEKKTGQNTEIKEKCSDSQFPSELRLDLISRDWVVIATGRAKKPEFFKQEKADLANHSPGDCPFCHMDTQEKPTLILYEGKELPLDQGIPENWTTMVVPNKYPAFIPCAELMQKQEGYFYQKMRAAGFHEVVVTKDHDKSIGQFSRKAMKELIDAYQSRYLSLMGKSFVNHISIFHNHGKAAGASVAHPHSQIITTPLVDVDLNTALVNAKKYFRQSKGCIYCQLLDHEKNTKKRVVFENKEFLIICPFASKSAFEMIISPKKHSPYFEKITEEEKWELAGAFLAAMSKLHKGLNDPAYNFYLHTSPSDNKKYPFYHWHWTILPKTATWAGFESGAGMEISTIEPEKAAEYLRNQ